jgi:hypothetical protein
MKLVIQTLDSKNEVIATVEVAPPDPYKERAYIDAAVQQAKDILYGEGFIGKNTRVENDLKQTVWMSYYK